MSGNRESNHRNRDNDAGGDGVALNVVGEAVLDAFGVMFQGKGEAG